MAWILRNLWLIPALPTLAAGISALLPQRRRAMSAGLAIGSMSLSLLLALCAFAHTLAEPARQVFNFRWMQFGAEWVSLGWVLDPLTAVMLVMVTFVGLLIFLFSVGYMAHDENFTRFFCFLSLFSGAMLGVVIANSLLLLFMCWEIVGLTSYLLIGFWYQRPSAAAAAKKAFITTRIGDLGLLLGMVWLYGQTGTLLFYDHGAGCMEHGALSLLTAQTTSIGMAVSTAIGLLIFCGAVGKSGQVPLHVWLPDAMEGPTPVSALIHAATMVAAGVFLVARTYPLMSASLPDAASAATTALQVIAWVGAITAVFAALIAVAQNDIKRILAYSTVSQLGYMMLGLGVGGVAVGMFHLITHAFFKALLFLGAGSVIHGCSDEQDIRRMGGLRRWMPVTFATYAAGMLALCGFPLFAGFWSKDEILHAAHGWSISQGPFYLGAFGALLTAFYMTRQVCYVFFGRYRSGAAHTADAQHAHGHDHAAHAASKPHESPAVMTVPLTILAVFAVLLGFAGTPAWPWFASFLGGEPLSLDFRRFAENGILPLMLASSLIVIAGLALGWWLYGRKPVEDADAPDVLERAQPGIFHALQNRLYVDEFYSWTIIRLARWGAVLSDWLDRRVWNGVVQLVAWTVRACGWFDASVDSYVVNAGFDESCRGVSGSGRFFSMLQNGQVQRYLRTVGIALAVLMVLLLWSRRG
ncbi:NADH-quinone oxidoreductase subunit L [Paracidobacterium acidisoli]|uniref:NADH-quinone oxidoreductase subunit L n=1 Tax=Paracidobacterium acidisoli TaxID=2303751 RepID=A0A372IU37_9BACT|nr:NADH-quinone oxidoreductase subunit L [Paracidobacterium acidisoli]MBT9329868.1 NADH-quinone oxidoreductase subunit L [Paracidobacterium acidisoli]